MIVNHKGHELSVVIHGGDRDDIWFELFDKAGNGIDDEEVYEAIKEKHALDLITLYDEWVTEAMEYQQEQDYIDWLNS